MLRKLDLSTGRPVWSAYRAPAVPTGSLTRDVKTDVLIVGMGISGAMMAEALTAGAHAVICIDRRGPLKGSTAATTALVQFEIDQPLSTLSMMIGKGQARQAWRRSRLAVSNLAARIAELGINCGISRTQSLYLAGTVLGPSELRDEAEARQMAGIGATYLTSAPLAGAFGIDRGGAILSHGNIALDPRKLTAGLLLKALERKARLYAPVEATAIEDSADEVVVATTDGPTITARHVVLATGYELIDIVPAAAHRVISTWAIATCPQPRKLWPGAAFIWEASDPYLYVRATADGRVICGGEDEEFLDETRRDKLIADKSARIAAKLDLMFPHLDTRPDFAWTGSFGTTTTGLPYIDAIPRHPRIHAVMGYGGNGITFSRIAAEIISASIGGLEDTDASLFAFNR
ncbi:MULTISPECIES: NAD(P)/FAD-dependent oxidoreductase [unclassified Mesorhizobium]|uniref:NAD(P)/FAD-dependent oxidoreductase n=1 Tax=unclassified Mesorhizobium TaxID=325217 RepID=UPI001CCD3286|nr:MULTISPECIES: FAD-binding oxidoreductase [unclassified Mesorhizobium]MBZ9680467.1 FAD-binding oxidoreductase [Mesorhizobium sp. CO1-1-2]MBZ9926293.1 FAD-binding oxidoreductase [Mesorhizobium sp. BR1-1-4]